MGAKKRSVETETPVLAAEPVEAKPKRRARKPKSVTGPVTAPGRKPGAGAAS